MIGARLAAWPQISVLVAKLCAEKTMKELVAAGQALGVPITAVLTPSRILASEHFQAVGAITDAELVRGAHRGAYRILRCRREARRFPYSGPRRGAGRTALARGSSAGAPTLRPGRRLSIRRSADS